MCDNCACCNPDEAVEQPAAPSPSVRFPNVTVKLIGENGNAFEIIGRVRRELRLHGAAPADLEQFSQEAMAGDYDALLQTVMRWVNVR